MTLLEIVKNQFPKNTLVSFPQLIMDKNKIGIKKSNMIHGKRALYTFYHALEFLLQRLLTLMNYYYIYFDIINDFTMEKNKK